MKPLLARAQILIQQQRFALAEKELHKMLSEDPNNATAHGWLAICLAERRAFVLAADSAKRCIALSPANSYGHYVLAFVCFKNRQFTLAATAVREALRFSPANPRYHTLLSEILGAQGRWPEALAAAQNALVEDPNFNNAIIMRAQVLRILGRHQEAHEEMHEALRINPESAEAHAALAWNYLQSGQRKKAEEHFRESLRLKPELTLARSGVLETLRANNLFYRPLIYVGALKEADKTSKRVVALLMVVPMLFAILIVRPIVNILLCLHPFGRLALSKKDRWEAYWTFGFLCMGLLSFLLGLYYSDKFMVVFVMSLLMILDMTVVFRASTPIQFRVFVWLTLVVSVCGGLFITLLFPVPNPYLTDATLSLWRAILGVAFFLGIWGLMLTPAIIQILRYRRWIK
jgi:tetratricopeptide (TPR) repeat protein